jgi:hypothetical protein
MTRRQEVSTILHDAGHRMSALAQALARVNILMRDSQTSLKERRAKMTAETVIALETCRGLEAAFRELHTAILDLRA